MTLERVGKYVLEERIAVGGMAEIFRARTDDAGELEKVLAIKRLHPHYAADAEFVKMLVNEAKLVVRLNHKNICQIFDLERLNGEYFIVMEYIHGRTLSRLIEKYKSHGQVMPLPLALFIAQEICCGLSYAHRRKDSKGVPLEVIHRDITSQNILLSFEGEVKIIDFGIAKASMHVSSSDAGQIKGKFQYMSPEQARGDRLDQRTDLFSVGAILYEMLTGHMPYEEEDEGKLMQLARRGQFPNPSAHRRDIPSEVEKLILKGMARDLGQRFQTAQQMQLAVSQLMFSLGEPCDEMQLSLLMRQLFEESASAGHSEMIELPQVKSQSRARTYKASGHSLLADLHAMGDQLEGDESADLPAFSPSSHQTVISGAGVGEGIDMLSATIPVMSVPNLPLKGGAQVGADDFSGAPTILDIAAPNPFALQAAKMAKAAAAAQAAQNSPSMELRRAALPEMPKAPDLEIKNQNESATRTDMPVPNIAASASRRDKGRGGASGSGAAGVVAPMRPKESAIYMVAFIISAVVAVALLLVLLLR